MCGNAITPQYSLSYYREGIHISCLRTKFWHFNREQTRVRHDRLSRALFRTCHNSIMFSACIILPASHDWSANNTALTHSRAAANLFYPISINLHAFFSINGLTSPHVVFCPTNSPEPQNGAKKNSKFSQLRSRKKGMFFCDSVQVFLENK